MRVRTTFGALIWLGSVLLVVAATPPLPAAPSVPLHERIANGLPTQQHPSTGWLIHNSAFGTSYCSGVLVGCQTFLTAAHCICTDNAGNPLSGSQCLAQPSLLDPSGLVVFLQNAGNFSVASVSVDPQFNFGVDGDFAVLHLTNPVTGVAPSPLNSTGRPPAGTVGTIVGFGLSGAPAFDVGIKRVGKVATSACPAGFVPDATNLCWVYQNPIGAPGTDSDTCEGDSGGPLFVDLGQGLVLAGLTSGGDTNCVPTDHSFDSDAFVNRAYLLSAGGADLGTASCGGLPAVGDPGSTVVTGSGTLSAAAPSQLFTVDVPPATGTLRVIVNVEPTGGANLFLKLGTTASPVNFDCRSLDNGEPNVCEVLSPAPGPWSVLVQRHAGSGDFQMTATYFASTVLPGQQFYTLPPCRLVDTRNPAGPLGGPALLPNAVRNFPLTGACGVPSDARALAVNVTVTQTAAAGFLRLYPGDLPSPPLVSSLNFQAGQTRSNNAILLLPATPGAGTSVSADSAGSFHFILDVTGYFR
ncbi:MAG TPA: trypsin-like serine protease [Thermoanaerobaculia bacterium]|nr:trypsin-like serine protease [Thermoanaerobaculia bacterium]